MSDQEGETAAPSRLPVLPPARDAWHIAGSQPGVTAHLSWWPFDSTTEIDESLDEEQAARLLMRADGALWIDFEIDPDSSLHINAGQKIRHALESSVLSAALDQSSTQEIEGLVESPRLGHSSSRNAITALGVEPITEPDEIRQVEDGLGKVLVGAFWASLIVVYDAPGSNLLVTVRLPPRLHIAGERETFSSDHPLPYKSDMLSVESVRRPIREIGWAWRGPNAESGSTAHLGLHIIHGYATTFRPALRYLDALLDDNEQMFYREYTEGEDSLEAREVETHFIYISGLISQLRHLLLEFHHQRDPHWFHGNWQDWKDSEMVRRVRQYYKTALEAIDEMRRAQGTRIAQAQVALNRQEARIAKEKGARTERLLLLATALATVVLVPTLVAAVYAAIREDKGRIFDALTISFHSPRGLLISMAVLTLICAVFGWLAYKALSRRDPY